MTGYETTGAFEGEGERGNFLSDYGAAREAIERQLAGELVQFDQLTPGVLAAYKDFGERQPHMAIEPIRAEEPDMQTIITRGFMPAPELYAIHGGALRALLMRPAHEAKTGNEAHVAFVRQMRQDARVFAATMREERAWTETASNNVEVKPASIFSHPEYRYDVYPFWAIRDKTRYGGSELTERKIHHDDRTVYKRIVILENGELAMVRAFSHSRNDWRYSPNDRVSESSFADRAPFSDKKGPERLYKEWLADLQAATKKYTTFPANRKIET